MSLTIIIMSCPIVRVKFVAGEQYTQHEAERAAGMTKEVLPPVVHAGMTTVTTAAFGLQDAFF
jgi:hypothetical protein